MVMQRLAVLAMVGVLGLGVTAAPAQAAGDAAAKPGKATARVAVTGDLVEPDGGVVKVNLHATERGDTDRGNLKFTSAEYGAYQGKVQTMTEDASGVKATGAGALKGANGKRQKVTFTATFANDGSSATITMTGKDGKTYTMAGRLQNGSVKVIPVTKKAKK